MIGTIKIISLLPILIPLLLALYSHSPFCIVFALRYSRLVLHTYLYIPFCKGYYHPATICAGATLKALLTPLSAYMYILKCISIYIRDDELCVSGPAFGMKLLKLNRNAFLFWLQLVQSSIHWLISEQCSYNYNYIPIYKPTKGNIAVQYDTTSSNS